MTILAIDQSTSASKAILFNDNGTVLDHEAVPHTQYYPQPGWVEHDAEEIYRNVVTAATSLLQRHPGQAPDYVSITNQRETVVVFERSTGRPLQQALVWQDVRGAGICAELEQAGYGPRVTERTGLKIDTYFSGSKLRWLVEQHPELAEQMRSGQALVGTIDAYIIYRLTHGQTFATDFTNASRTLLFDIHRLCWDEELCDLFKVPAHALPEVRESRAAFGETTFEGALAQALPIYGVMGDSQAALFGQRCFTCGAAKVTFGTGSSILLNLGAQPQPAPLGIVTALAWVDDGQPTYAYEGITNFTGATIAWLRNQLGLIERVEDTEALARSVPDNGGVYLVPAFAGLSAPYWKAEARAAIVGLSAGSGKAHVARAGLESIAYIINNVLETMSKQAGVALSTIHADGGAVRNSFLMQFVSDLTGLKVRAAQTPELSALGAVLAGALGIGRYRSLDDLQALPTAYQDYSPQLASDEVERLLAGWRQAVQRVLL